MTRGRAFEKRDHPKLAGLRRTQVITTYGIGSLIPVGAESFLMLGQDHWPNRREDTIQEPALARVLKVKGFRQPPSGAHNKLPVIRFPWWVNCPSCDRLAPWKDLAASSSDGIFVNLCRNCLSDGKRVQLIPSRFVAACSSGHLQDFPYDAWVHFGIDRDGSASHQLRIRTSSQSDSLSSIRIVCSCGATRSMAGALGQRSLRLNCSGKKPWLRGSTPDECQNGLIGLQRGASNVWIAETRSAIQIDRAENPCDQIVIDQFDFLNGTPLDQLEMVLNFVARQNDVPVDELKQAYTRRQLLEDEESRGEIDLRNEEFDAFCTRHPEVEGDETFVCYPSTNENSDFGIEVVSRVPRMREVKAITGFSRVGHKDNEQGRLGSLLADARMDWLPAIEVFGEGIFLKLDPGTVNKWAASEYAISRAEKINSAPREVGGELITPEMLLIHSLSHVLINELALITGYPASSIRERLYVNDNKYGIFLYTATGDAAGSLGGLCAQGTLPRFREILKRAILGAQWCSADPVCIESETHGVDNTNLAACHYCMLIPEVSCEAKNQFLDRACLVGDPNSDGEGFFSTIN